MNKRNIYKYILYKVLTIKAFENVLSHSSAFVQWSIFMLIQETMITKLSVNNMCNLISTRRTVHFDMIKIGNFQSNPVTSLAWVRYDFPPLFNVTFFTLAFSKLSIKFHTFYSNNLLLFKKKKKKKSRFCGIVHYYLHYY